MKWKVRVSLVTTSICFQDTNSIWFFTFSSRNMFPHTNTFNTSKLRLYQLFCVLLHNIYERFFVKSHRDLFCSDTSSLGAKDNCASCCPLLYQARLLLHEHLGCSSSFPVYSDLCHWVVPHAFWDGSWECSQTCHMEHSRPGTSGRAQETRLSVQRRWDIWVPHAGRPISVCRISKETGKGVNTLYAPQKMEL